VSTGGTPRTRSLDKAVTLLHAVADRPRSAVGLARETGIPRATVARTLWTLADAGLVEETEDGWVLGYELVRLARRADPDGRLLRVARPIVAALRDASGESALVGVPREPVTQEIVLQLDGPHLVGVASWVGTTVPLHASAAGKLMLAELDRESLDAWLTGAPLTRFTRRTRATPKALLLELDAVRRSGFAELVDELEDGLTSLAAPVRDRDRALVAMVGISGPTARLGPSRRAVLRREILAAADAIERQLDGAGASPLPG
jgi:DNA-binding IclR family transcriptional regulator